MMNVGCFFLLPEGNPPCDHTLAPTHLSITKYIFSFNCQNGVENRFFFAGCLAVREKPKMNQKSKFRKTKQKKIEPKFKAKYQKQQ